MLTSGRLEQAGYQRHMKLRTLWLMVLILLLAAGLRAWNLSTQSIWFDEGFSWHAATQPDLIATLNGDPTNPPLYYLLLHIWVRLTGDSEFALRAFSLLQGILLLAVMGFAARRWSGRRWSAVLAMALGAFLPLLWWASQEARMYNTLALAVLVMALGLMRLLGEVPPSRGSWAAALGGELVALYTHNTGIVVLGAANAAVLGAWLWAVLRRQQPRPGFRAWVTGQIVIGLLWLPELLARFASVGAANAATGSTALSPEMLWYAWQALWASSWEMVRQNDLALRGVALLLLPLIPLALTALRSRWGRLLGGLIAGLFVVLIVALAVPGIHMHGRYLVMIAPLAVIMLAGGTAALVSQARWTRLLAGASVLAVAMAWTLLPGRPDPAFQHDQAREMVAYYADVLGPDDRVLAWSYADRYELRYYWSRLHVLAELIALPEGADADEIVPLLNAHLPQTEAVRVELNTWYTQRADARGMLPCLLGHGQPALSQTYSVYGMSTTAYRIRGPLLMPSGESAAPVNFGALTLEPERIPADPFPADRGVCLAFTVTVNERTQQDVQVAVNALNPQGWEIAGDDAPVLTAAQVPVSRLDVGQTARAYALLYFPQGTPPGEYPLRVRVYSESNPSGFDVRDPATGAPTGKDVSLGVLRVLHADWPPFEDDCMRAAAPDVSLSGCEETGGELVAGDSLRLTFRWQTAVDSPEITVRLAGDGWEVADTRALTGRGAVLDWRALPVPAEAAGTAELTVQVGEGSQVSLAEYMIVSPEHRMTAPEVERRLDVTFPGVGTLYGLSLPEGSEIPGGMPFEAVLVWQAAGVTDIPYTVTVQLLDAEGRLLAQHDSQPGSSTRPTTGWIAGEYVIDPHTLAFRPERADYRGPARLIVALYDPADGARLMTASDADHAVAADNLVVVTP